MADKTKIRSLYITPDKKGHSQVIIRIPGREFNETKRTQAEAHEFADKVLNDPKAGK